VRTQDVQPNATAAKRPVSRLNSLKQVTAHPHDDYILAL
jgi:hypothetical protein